MHGRVAAHAADLLVDAPALAGGVATPDETLAAGGAAAAELPGFRCGAERALRGLAGVAVGVLKVQAQREAGAGGQVLGVDLGGEVGRLGRGAPAQHPLEGAAAAEW